MERLNEFLCVNNLNIYIRHSKCMVVWYFDINGFSIWGNKIFININICSFIFGGAGTFSSLASLSAPRMRDSIIALRAPFCVFRGHFNLFFFIYYYDLSIFYKIFNVNLLFSKLLRLWEIYTHNDTRASRSIFTV